MHIAMNFITIFKIVLSSTQLPASSPCEGLGAWLASRSIIYLPSPARGNTHSNVTRSTSDSPREDWGLGTYECRIERMQAKPRLFV